MKLNVRKSGDATKPPLIILHGVFGMKDNWMTLSKQFAEEGFYVLTVDARNHGQSPWDEAMNYEVMAADLVELMDEERLKKAVVMGHSMGGKTAMWMASLYAERMEKMIVVDISVTANEDTNATVRAALHAIDLSAISSRKEAEAKLREALTSETTTQFLAKSLYWKESGMLAWRFNLEALEKNAAILSAALPESLSFAGPSLFVRGDRSDYITDKDLPLIKKHFPKAQIATVSNAGHWVHADNPQGFFKVVMHFLEKK